jgi:hypothetical protein
MEMTNKPAAVLANVNIFIYNKVIPLALIFNTRVPVFNK